MKCFDRALLSVVVAVLAAPLPASEKARSDSSPNRARLEQEFAEKLTGAALVGSFTVDGQKLDAPPKPERYEISKAEKVEGDLWEITARMKYGNIDAQVPIRLYVYWADDTPVMSLTDLTIPLMKGKFTARVLFYGDRYVGTWQHDQVGGHMFGKIERAAAADANGNAAAGHQVSGVVTLNGQPLENAVIEFTPDDGRSKPASGRTDAAGRYKLKAPTGSFQVTIGQPKDVARRTPIPAKYSDRDSSPLRIEVSEGENEFNFDLRSS